MVTEYMKQGPVLPEAVRDKDCALTLWFSSLLLDIHLEMGTFPDSSWLLGPFHQQVYQKWRLPGNFQQRNVFKMEPGNDK